MRKIPKFWHSNESGPHPVKILTRSLIRIFKERPHFRYVLRSIDVELTMSFSSLWKIRKSNVLLSSNLLHLNLEPLGHQTGRVLALGFLSFRSPTATFHHVMLFFTPSLITTLCIYIMTGGLLNKLHQKQRL